MHDMLTCQTIVKVQCSAQLSQPLHGITVAAPIAALLITTGITVGLLMTARLPLMAQPLQFEELALCLCNRINSIGCPNYQWTLHGH